MVFIADLLNYYHDTIPPATPVKYGTMSSREPLSSSLRFELLLEWFWKCKYFEFINCFLILSCKKGTCSIHWFNPQFTVPRFLL